MIKPDDTYLMTKDNNDIEKLIKQTNGTRLSEEQSKKLIELIQQNNDSCFDYEGYICKEHCKEQEKLNFPKVGD